VLWQAIKSAYNLLAQCKNDILKTVTRGGEFPRNLGIDGQDESPRSIKVSPATSKISSGGLRD